MAEDIRALVDRLLKQSAALQATAEEVKTAIAVVPSSRVVRVRPGDNVQAALDSLTDGGGGSLLLYPGVYSVNLTLRERPADAGMVVIRTDTANLPEDGKRIGPEFQSGLAMLQAADRLMPAVLAAPRARNYLLLGIGTLPQAYDRTVIDLGDSARYLTRVEDCAENIVLDRLLMLGDPVRGQHRAVQANARKITIRGCHIAEFHEEGRDSQAICGWNGSQYVVVENNYLEAGAENVLIGGGDSASLEMTPTDWIIRGNHIRKNPAWWDAGFKYVPNTKCLVETKNVRRCLIEGNLIEWHKMGSWANGMAFTLKSCNGESKEVWAATQDLVFQHNIIRDVGSVCTLVGQRDSGRPSDIMLRVRISNNVFYNVTRERGDGRGLQLAEGAGDVIWDHNTTLGTTYNLVSLWGVPWVGPFTFTNNIVPHGEYGVSAPTGNGSAALDNFVGKGKWKFEANAVQRHPARVSLPPGNTLIDGDLRQHLDENLRVKAGTPLATIKTTDGKPVGADIDAIFEKMGDRI